MLSILCLVLLPWLALLGCLYPFRFVLARGRVEIVILAALVVLFLWPLLLGGGAIVQKDANLLQIPFLQNYRLCFRELHAPLWNPAVWLGVPSLAHPLLHAFHPITPLAAVLPAHAALNLGIAAMLFLSCVSMFLLVRQLGQARPVALVAAVAYGFNEFTLDRIGAATGPGVEYLYSYAFVPLCLAHLIRAAATGRVLHGVFLGLSLVFVLNGNPNLFYYALILAIAALGGLPLVMGRRHRIGPALAAFGLALVVVVLVDAVELFPFLEFEAKAGSSRLVESAGGWRMAAISLPSLPSLVLPHLPRAHFGYAGRIGWVGLALVAVALCRWRRRDAGIVILMLALGAVGLLLVTHSPVFDLMEFCAPLFGRISMVPAVFILFVLPLSLLAGMGAGRLSRGGAAVPTALALLLFGEVFGASLGAIPWTRFTRLTTFDYAAELSDFPHLDAVADPSGTGAYRIECRTPHAAMVCPDYALAARHLRLVGGDRYHFPAAEARRLAKMTGPARDLLDVRYVLAPIPLDDTDLTLRDTIRWGRQATHEEMALRDATRQFNAERARPWDGTVYVYEAGHGPHAFLVGPDFREATIPADPVVFEVTSFTPASIVLSGRAPRGGMLFVSEVYASGWRAVVDGHSAAITRLDGGFIGVAVPAGAETVRLRYEPVSFRAGLWTSGLTLVTFLLLAVSAGRSDALGTTQGP